MRKRIETSGAPEAIGPYSQAIRAGDWVWCSGQIALHPETNEIIGKTAAEQTEQVLANLEAVLSAADSGLADTVKCTIYLADLADFAAVNRAYERRMPTPAPARATVEVSRLPKDVRVEIDAVAFAPRT